MKIALAITALLLALLVLPQFFLDAPPQALTLQDDHLPWKVEGNGDGTSRVFGLVLGKSTLADLVDRFGNDFDMALIAAPGETGTVEQYFERLPEGYPAGRIIVTAELADAQVAAMKDRAGKFNYMDSSTRKYPLASDDRQQALAARIRSLSFIPAANLDEQTILDRFGQPGERIRLDGGLTHYLYPGKGLDVVYDPKGKELLQFVPPQAFGTLRAPLANAAASPQSGK